MANYYENNLEYMHLLNLTFHLFLSKRYWRHLMADDGIKTLMILGHHTLLSVMVCGYILIFK